MPQCRSVSRSRSRNKGADDSLSVCESAEPDAPTDCEPLQRSTKDLVNGVRDFQGKRLQFLQIGLGTYGTFAHNLAEPENAHFPITWIMDTVSDNTTSMLAVGVEPVPEHVNALLPSLKLLPNTSLVRAAIASATDNVLVHTITPEAYARCLEQVPAEHLDDFTEQALYLRNMSCVGQDHPQFNKCKENIRKDFNVELELEPIAANSLTYGDLCELLNFDGVEALVIDAEGHDYDILRSMIEYCTKKHKDAWPDFIQFESMWHNDLVPERSWYDEGDICRALTEHGYVTAKLGLDTVMIRSSAIQKQPRIQRWAEGLRCNFCTTSGEHGFPFELQEYVDVCKDCIASGQLMGAKWDDWRYLPGLDDRTKLLRLTTDGTNVFGLSEDGKAYAYVEPRWELLSSISGLKSISVSLKGKISFAVDDAGRVWQCSTQSKPWSWKQARIDFAVNDVALATDGESLWVVASDNTVYVGNTSSLDSLRQIKGQFQEICAASSDTDIWGVNRSGEVYCRWGDDAEWSQDESPHLQRVAVSGDGKHVWGVACSESDSWLYCRRWRYNWVEIPGCMTDVAVSFDGSIIWAIDGNGRALTCAVSSC